MATITITLRDVPYAGHCAVHVGGESADFLDVENKKFTEMTASQQILLAFNRAVDDLVETRRVDKEFVIRDDIGYVPNPDDTLH